MGKKKIGVVLAADGEKEYTQAIRNAGKSLAVLKSESGKLRAEFEGQQNTIEALSKTHEVLQKRLSVQIEKEKTAQDGLRHASSTMDAAKKRAEELADALKNAEQKLTDSGTSSKELQSKLKDQEKQIESLSDELKIAEAAYEEMKQSGTKTSDEMKKQADHIKEVEESLKKVKNEQKETKSLIAPVKDYTDALERQNSEIARCENHIKTWQQKLNTAQKEVIEAQRAVNKYAEYMKEAEASTDGCASSIDKFGKATKDSFSFGLMEGVIAGAGGKLIESGVDLLKAGATAAKEAMVDTSKASAQLAASTGLSESAAKRYQKVMQQIKGNNFGEDYEDVASAMAEVIQIMGELDDGAMQDITESAITLRDTFGMEVNESIRAADVMMKTMGVDAATAFDLIVKGAQNGLNRSGELVDNITEYGQLWGQAGFSAQEMFAILENGLNSGAYNLDKVNDYVKEFSISLADGRIEENISSFSKETAALFESWKNGEASASDVFYSVINDLSEMENKQKALTIASDVWSALGEDNAMQVLEALDDVNSSYDDVQGAMDRLKETKFSDLESAIGNLGSALQERFVTPIADAAAPAIAGLANAAADIIAPAEEKVDQFYEDVMSVSETIKQNVENVGEEFSAATEGVERVTALGSRLQELNGVEKRTAVQKQEMAAVVAELSKSIPELAGAYDAERDSLSLTNGELKELIANYKETAVQKAVLAATQELVNQKLEAQVAIDKAQTGKENADARIKLLERERDLIGEIQVRQMNGDYSTDYQTEALKLYQEALDNGIITMEEFSEVQKKIAPGQMENRLAAINGEFWDGGEAAGIMHASLSGLTEQSDGYNKVISEQTKILKDCDDQGAQYVKTAEEMSGVHHDLPDELNSGRTALKEYWEEAENAVPPIEEVGKSIFGMGSASTQAAKEVEDASERMGQAAEENAEAQKAAADAQKEAIQEVRDAYDETWSSIESDLRNKVSLTDKFDGGEDLTTEKMNEILEENLKKLENYQENLAKVRQMTDENGKAIFSPEALAEIEKGGTEYANILDHIVSTWEAGGDYNYEQVKGISDKITEGLDMTEQIADAAAANQVALDAMMGNLGSTDADFSDLRSAIETAAASAAEGWASLPQETQTALQETVSVAQQIGVTIPDGLADGILSGETSPEQAIEQLNGSIQGRFEGFAEIARSMGIKIPDEISAGITAGGQSTVDAYNSLIAMLSQAAAQAGAETATATQTSIEDGTPGVEQASGSMASAGATAAAEKTSEYQTAGEQAATQYGTGIGSGKTQTISQARQMAQQALSAVKTYENSFYNVGVNIASGLANGIRGGQSNAISAAASMARQALSAAKAELDIRSPSRKFRNEVGQMIPKGMAFGISDKASLAGKAAKKMSNKVYTNATAWLSKYKRRQEVSLADEKWYWEQVLKHTKSGTSAYNKALKKVQNISIAELTASGLSSSVASQVAKNFGVSKTTGSGKRKKKKSDDTYYSDVYQAAQKYVSNQQILQDWSLQQELSYWTAVQGRLKKGTQAWYDATKQVKDLKAEIAEADQKAAEAAAKAAEDEKKAAEERGKAHADVQDDILNKYKVYYKVSAKAEADYWNIARKQFAAGTDERIEADRKYLDALQEFYDQRKELDEDYAENAKDINDKLKEDIEELQDSYKDAVQSRKDDILSQMNLFEAWDSEGYDADTLLYNLKTQVAGLTLWEQQLEELGKKGLSADLMEELKAMGPDAAASIYSLNQMTAAQLDEYNKLWQQKNALAQSQAVKDNESLRDETNKQITDIRTEAQSELNALNADYRAALAELNKGISGELVNLVSRAGSIGEDAVSGLVASIGRAADSVETYNSTTKLVTTVSSQLSALQQEGGVIGKNTLDGLLASLTDEAKINTASRKVIQSIKRAMEDEAEIHSPARLFRRETGPQIPAGVAEGMEDGTEYAVDSSRSMMRKILAGTREELGRQQAKLQAEVAGMDFSGIARLNRMAEQYQPPATVVNVDNGSVVEAMKQMFTSMNAIMERMERMQVVMYPDALIGEIREGLDKANADAAVIRNRGW